MKNPNTHNRLVAGSNPAEPTFYCGREVDIKYRHLSEFSGFSIVAN